MFEGDSTQDLTFSFHRMSLSCWRPMYFAHMVFAYLICITGIICFVTRLHPRLYFLHIWFARFYIVSMLWGTATSILIHNTGLPTGVIYSFLWTLLGLSIGWFFITLHQKRIFKSKPRPKSKIADVLSRMISLKGIHGCLMFVSWINIAGRVFVTPVTADFECYAQSAFKPITSRHYNYTGGPIEFVPREDPDYARTPWGNKEGTWALGLSVGMYALAFVVGLVYLLITVKKKKTDADGQPENDV